MEIGVPLFPLQIGFMEGKASQNPAPAGESFKMYLTEELLLGEEENMPQNGKALKKSSGFLLGAFHQGFGDSEVPGLIIPFDSQPADSFMGLPFLPVFNNLIQAEGLDPNKSQEMLSDLPSLLEKIGIRGQWNDVSKAVLQPETASPKPQPSGISLSPIVLNQQSVTSPGPSEAQAFAQSSIPTQVCEKAGGFFQENGWSGRQEIQPSSTTLSGEEMIVADSRGIKSGLTNIRSPLQEDEKMIYQSGKSFLNPPPPKEPLDTENPSNHSFFFQNHEKPRPQIRPFNLESEGIDPSIGEEFKGMGKIVLEKGGVTVFSTNENQNQDDLSLFFIQNGHQKTGSLRPHEPHHGQEVSTKGEFSEIYQQIGRRVVWSLRNNEERIKLTLDPPELGNIYMEINREKMNIKAILWADHQGTKEILEAHQTQLQKMLKEDGFELKRFDVFVRQETGPFGERRDGPMDHRGHWLQEEVNESERPNFFDPLNMAPEIIYPSLRGTHTLDLFV